MPIINPFEKANLKILSEIVTYTERAAKSNAVPIGQERVSKQSQLNRLQKMSPDERVAMLKQQGSKMLEML